MSKTEKTLERVLSGRQDKNIDFQALCTLLLKLGFVLRQEGSHRNFRKSGFDAVNLQPSGHLAKSYQVKQVRETLKKGGY